MRILAVGAHLDDIEIACGGTLCKAIKNGSQVRCIVMSKSGYKDINNNVSRTNEAAISEGLAAFNCLGITNVKIYDFENTKMGWDAEIIKTIEREIIDFNPDLIITHHPNDTHQDHVGVSKSCISAARRHNNVLFFEPIPPSGRSNNPFNPQVYLDISETIDSKIESLRCHTTEYKKFGEEAWITGIYARAQFRGYECGSHFAECFEVLRLSDTCLSLF